MRHVIRFALPLLLLLSACGSAAPNVVQNNVQPGSSPHSNAAASASPSAAPTGTLVPTAEASPTSEPTPTEAATATAEPTVAPTATTQAEPTPTTASAQPTAGTTADGTAIRPELDGRIAFVRGGSIYTYNPQNGAVEVLIENGRDPQFSSDGSRLAFVRDDGLYVAAADGSNPQQIVAQPDIQSPRWTDDGSKIAFERVVDRAVRGRGEVWTVELPSNSTVKIADGGDPAWAPDSKRVAYITAPGEGFPRRNQVRLTNWLGQNDWGVIRQLPANTPPTGIPGGQLPPADLEHVLFSPMWGAEGAFIYAPAFLAMQVETDFVALERGDATNGGATYLTEMIGVNEAVASPDRRGAIFSAPSARGDVQLLSRPLDANMSGNPYAWAETREVAVHEAPAWSPDSNAIVFYRCSVDDFNQCDLALLEPGLEAPVVLVPDVFGEAEPDRQRGLSLAWGR